MAVPSPNQSVAIPTMMVALAGDRFEIPDELLPFRTAEFIIAATSMSLNLLIIYFIIFKTPKELKEYRYFLFLISHADFQFDLFVIFLMQPVVLLPLYGAIVTGPLQYLGQVVGTYASVIVPQFLFFYCMFTVNLAFIFCYVCIVSNRLRQLFVSWPIQVLLNVLGMGLGLIVPAICCMTLFGREHLDQYVTHRFPTYTGLTDSVIFVIGGDFTVGYVILAWLSMSCGLNVAIALKIVRKLWSSRQRNSTYQMQLRLTVCLLLQTFSPFVLLCCPVTIIVVLYIVRAPAASFKTMSDMLVLLVSLHPLVNAICTLSFVQPYRRLLIRDEWLEAIWTRLCGGRNQKMRPKSGLTRLDGVPMGRLMTAGGGIQTNRLAVEACQPTESNQDPRYIKDVEQEQAVEPTIVEYQLYTNTS